MISIFHPPIFSFNSNFHTLNTIPATMASQWSANAKSAVLCMRVVFLVPDISSLSSPLQAASFPIDTVNLIYFSSFRVRWPRYGPLQITYWRRLFEYRGTRTHTEILFLKLIHHSLLGSASGKRLSNPRIECCTLFGPGVSWKVPHYGGQIDRAGDPEIGQYWDSYDDRNN